MEISQQNYLSKVSIVIPSVVSDIEQLKTLLCRDDMDLFFQIFVVFSGVESGFKDFCESYFLPMNKRPNISFICVEGVLHPGQARNIGVDAVETEYVSFLDARTLPSPAWFESVSDFVRSHTYDLQLSSVQYNPTSFFAEIFAAATFGFSPLTCLPGSVLTVASFRSIGGFISARSGEDSEWINRSKLIGLTISKSSSRPLLVYNLNVTRNSFLSLIQKWFRYYSVSFCLPGYQAHKYLYTILGSSVFLLFLSMWNWRIARWDEASPLYLPFITRVALIIIFAFYLVFRGLYLPYAKGVFRKRRSSLIVLFSLPVAVLLDVVKMIAGFRVIFDQLFSQKKPDRI